MLRPGGPYGPHVIITAYPGRWGDIVPSTDLSTGPVSQGQFKVTRAKVFNGFKQDIPHLHFLVSSAPTCHFRHLALCLVELSRAESWSLLTSSSRGSV